MPGTMDARGLQLFDPVLSNVARQYKPFGHVYNDVTMAVPVSTVSGQYPIFDERYFYGDDVDNKLADRAETPEIDLFWSTDTYLCEDYGLKVSITPRERQQANSPAGLSRLEESKVQLLVTRCSTRRERRLAAVLKKTTNGGQLNLGGAATTAFATSTAIEADWKTAKMAVFNATGLTPNVAILPYATAYDMATNATLRDLFKYIVNTGDFIKLGAGPDGEDMFLPRVFHGTRLIIPKGTMYHTGNPKATLNLADVWAGSVRFLYKPETEAWGTPSTVYSFWHAPLTVQGDGANGPVIDRWHENDPVKDLIRQTECVAEKVVAPNTGFELTGV